MEQLLADEPNAIVEGVGLISVALGLLLSSVARQRADRVGNRVAQLFWREASQAGYLWAAATTVTLVGALAEVEGLRSHIWLLLAVAVGIVCLALARVRWERLDLPERTRLDDASRPERPRIASTTWEVAALAAGIGGLLVYGVTVAHAWGHPIHWGIAVIGGVFGYAVGLLAATPRYSVRSRST